MRYRGLIGVLLLVFNMSLFYVLYLLRDNSEAGISLRWFDLVFFGWLSITSLVKIKMMTNWLDTWLNKVSLWGFFSMIIASFFLPDPVKSEESNILISLGVIWMILNPLVDSLDVYWSNKITKQGGR